MIAIVDFGVGNVMSVVSMIHYLGHYAEITAEPSKIKEATHIILPGTGSFDACMRGLRQSGLIGLLEERIFEYKTPFLGICVGAQMLANGSEEGSLEGLGWIQMKVLKLPRSKEFPTPHMGWNYANIIKNNKLIIDSEAEKNRFYFVHSYYLSPENEEDVLSYTNYGINFASSVSRDNIYGVQFHPEKSHKYGKNLFNNFLNLNNV